MLFRHPVLSPPQSGAGLVANKNHKHALFGDRVMRWSRSLAVLALLATTPAVAQVYPAEPYYRSMVLPEQVIDTVRSLGLRPVNEPRLRGPVWVVRALAREGTLIRVVVDSRSGRVVEMHAVDRADPRFAMRGPGYRPYYEAPPYDGGPRGPYETAPYHGGQAVPDDDDGDGLDEPAPRPRGYVPHSSLSEPHSPQSSAKPAEKRLASKPPAAVPMPKARPADIKAANQSKTGEDADPAVAAASKEPVTTGSVTSPGDEKAAVPADAKKTPVYPVQPLE